MLGQGARRAQGHTEPWTPAVEHTGYHAASKWRPVPDILVCDLGVTQVELHDALLPQVLCVQLEARSLLETRRNLSDQLPLRVRQPHHLWREQDRGWLWQRWFTKLVTPGSFADRQFTRSQKQNHMRLPSLSHKLSRRHLQPPTSLVKCVSGLSLSPKDCSARNLGGEKSWDTKGSGQGLMRRDMVYPWKPALPAHFRAQRELRTWG